jgi:hypothetical protein
MLERLRANCAAECGVCIMLARRFVTALCVMGGSVPALSCFAPEEASGYDRLGVKLVDGAILVRYLACDGEDVKFVRLYELDDDNVAPEEGDDLLWEAVDPESTVLASGLVPTPADGEPIELFQETEYWVEVVTNQNTVDSNEFGAADLSTSDYYVHRRTLDDAEFTRAADKSCGGSP